MNYPAPIARIGGALTIVFGISAPVDAKGHPNCTDLEAKGTASWYGEEVAIGKKHGQYIYNPTASGEKFNPEGISAAHKTLPLGTFVRVQRVDNGQSLIVKINDRGPYAKGRILDLSRGAAEALGMKEDGEKRVAIYTCDM